MAPKNAAPGKTVETIVNRAGVVEAEFGRMIHEAVK